MTGIVKERQTVFDLALQYLGSAEGCFTVADALGICVTDIPTPGAEFEYSAADVLDGRVVEYYAVNGIVPTTEN